MRLKSNTVLLFFISKMFIIKIMCFAIIYFIICTNIKIMYFSGTGDPNVSVALFFHENKSSNFWILRRVVV